MKKIFLIQWATTAIFCIAVGSGCSKDNVIPPTEGKKSFGKAPTFTDQYPDIQNFGKLAGTILPIEAKAKVYLSGAASIVLSVDSTGKIPSQQIPSGQYTVDIIPEDYYNGSYTVSNVLVFRDSVTNLGTITLEYYGGGGSGCEIGWGRQRHK